MNVSWLYMWLAIISELLATTFLKLSHGFTEIVPSIMVFIFYAVCFSLFALALKTLNLSLAYSVWSGLGILGTALIGILWLHEELTWVKVVGITLITIGVVTLNLTNVAEENSKS